MQEFDVTFLYTDGSTDYDTTVRAEDAVGAAALAKEDFMVGHDGEPDEVPRSIVVMRNRVTTNFDFETKAQTFAA